MSPVVASDALLVTFPEKPPYYYFVGSEPQGLLLDKARRIFAEAGVAASYEMRPAKRALFEVSQGTQPLCSLGWFRNPEREQYAQFSLPLHRDAAVRLLVPQRLEAEVKHYRSLQALLQQSTMRLGLVEGFSYGATADAQLKAFEHKVLRVPVTVKQLMQMVAHGRVDMALIDELEFTHRSKDIDLRGLELATVAFPDIAPGNQRHLMCSRAVEPVVMARINAAIVKLGYQP